jgi:hypothetical protein
MTKTLRIFILVAILLTSRAVWGQTARQFHRNGLALVESGNYREAVVQFSLALRSDSAFSEALYSRAQCLEKAGDTLAALTDYRRLETGGLEDPFIRQHVDEVRARLFELNLENNPPIITLLQPELPPDSILHLPRNRYSVSLTVRITDQSDLDRASVNNQQVTFTKNGDGYEFTTIADLTASDRITLTATDVYNNTRKVRLALQRTETDPPWVSLQEPYASDDGEIYLDSDSKTLEVEGTVHDENLISAITVDGIPAFFNKSERNPDFLTTLDMSDRYSFTVTATDIFGNDTSCTYVLNREAMFLKDKNPAGPIWVIFIENTDYASFPSFDNASSDLASIRSSLSRYVIHRIIHKKNMTKMETERFFSIELRDLLKDAEIGALLVWFSGHGMEKGGAGYWIPADARRDEPVSWYNLHALRASLQSYNRNIAHFLVVSNAGYPGPEFCTPAATEPAIPECGNTDLFRPRSAQSLSSPGADQGLDRSLFAKTFAAVLDENSEPCLPVETIFGRLNEVLKPLGSHAEIGPITGLTHEGGTFFFFTKSLIQ